MLWRFTNYHFHYIFAETLYSNQFVIMLLKAVLDYTQRSDSRSRSSLAPTCLVGGRIRLPNYLYGKLNLSCRCRCRSQQAR
jgi:hypothetical protein